ncbi:unnamed protein product [Callosobruchus maculatus]|uniref:RING finger protein 17 n=2 Tax=Callosobruchus maculatus TaxID=64391 RepID=A0A653CZF3_CALMS|nr:unnamed protein product [Callosobruchus maculatus]
MSRERHHKSKMPNRKNRNPSHSVNRPYYSNDYDLGMQSLPSFYDYPSTSGDFTRPPPPSMMYQNQNMMGCPNRDYSYRDNRKEFFPHDNRQLREQAPRDPVSYHNQRQPPRPSVRGRDRNYQLGFQEAPRPTKQERRSSNRSNSSTSNDLSSITDTDSRLYLCPGCSKSFEFISRANQLVGRVPLVLNCKHTTCQECVHRMALDDKIVCPQCHNPSVLADRRMIEDLQEVFPVNSCTLGIFVVSRCKGIQQRGAPIGMVPVEQQMALKEIVAPNTQICAFYSCTKPAKLRCKDCNDVYCAECSVTIHKSGKSLWGHEQHPLEVSSDLNVSLEKCEEHGMDVEFFCKDCKQGACCYCFLEKHEGHEKDNLAKLSEEEMKKFLNYRHNMEAILKQLMISERRIKDLYNYNAVTAEKKICSYFINLHAKISAIENNLRKEVRNFQDISNSSKKLDTIHSNLAASIEQVKQLMIAGDQSDFRKVNLKMLLGKIEEVQTVPCYLTNMDNKGLDPIRFEVDPILEKLDDLFKVAKNEIFECSLASMEQLPSDYKKDPAEFQYEADIENCISSIHKSAKSIVHNKNKNIDLGGKLPGKTFNDKNEKLETESVEVTHIESLECFYIQFKKNHFRFFQLEKDINNYAQMAGPVDHPELHHLYLVLYTTKKEKRWCRGRLIEFKNGEKEPLYEIFFIDFGSTQTVNISKLREMTPNLELIKPFAIRCELYNPANISWNRNAHVYMGKMINGKDLFMMLKNIHDNIHVVDLLVSSSDGGMTSIVDIMINTCSNPLSTVSDDGSSVSSSHKVTFSLDNKVYSNSVKFDKNATFEVILANVVDPHNIFVQIASNTEILQKMSNAMKNYYKNLDNTSCVPVEGSFVAVQNKDAIRGHWHRALINKVNLNNGTATVKFIDWGNNVVVSWNNIRMLADQFCRLESQAILVRLAHIEPCEGSLVWSDKAAAFLQKHFSTQEPLKMKVINTDPLEVALFQMKDTVDICINAQLVAEKLAVSTGKVSQVVEWPNVMETRGFETEGGFLEGLLEKSEESDYDDESDEEDRNVVKQPINVVKVVSPELIHIKFQSLVEKEQALHKELQIHYFKEHETKESWEIDELCVVSHSNFYIRGKIVAKLPDNKYRINIYDLVEEVTKHVSNIFVCTKYFAKQPNSVFKAHLGDIRPAGGDKWSLSSIETLQKIFEKYKDIYGTKIPVVADKAQTSKSIPMHMWYMKVKVGGALEANITKFISVNNKLVKMGFAYKASSPKDISMLSSSEASDKLLATICKASDDDKAEISNKPESKAESTVFGNVKLQKNTAADKNSTEGSEASESQKGKVPVNWYDLVEEEEKKIGSQNDSPYHTKEADIEDWKPPFPIDKEEFYAIIITAENEGYIYLREETLHKVYLEMEGNINEYFADKTPTEKEKHQWEVGQLCTVAGEDGKFYRGKVYGISPEGITVVMIDFGSDHLVKPKQLYREILYPKIPAFASRVKLDRVYPKCGQWLSSDYEYFLNLCPNYARIVVKSTLDVEVPLVEVFTSDGVNINHLLTQRCPNLTRCESLDSSRTEDEDEEGAVIEEEESIVYDPEKDELNLTMLKAPQKYAIEPLPNLGPDDKILMTIIAVLAFNKVVIKPASCLPTEELLDLGQQIDQNHMEQPVVKKTDIRIGMPCICRYSEDEVWYRAEIFNIDGLDCGYVFVFFVDFGNVESVTVDNIKEMKKEWFDQPVSSHIAELAIELKTENHTEHVFQQIRKLYEQEKYVKVVIREPLRVHLYEENGELCYQSMVERGLLSVRDV